MIKEKIGEEYLIPLLGVWRRAEDIDFHQLPDSFVLKTNNASGTNIIVRNKKDVSRKRIVEQLNYSLKYPFWARGGEFHYREIPPKIIAEQFMRNEGMDDLPDYKFYCFHGKPYCLSVDMDRYHGAKQTMYDLNWTPQVWRLSSFGPYTGSIERPEQLETMLTLAETLCEGFSHVRVDFYLIQQKVYFGEMTFTPGCGYLRIIPDEYDFILGEQWHIDWNPEKQEAVAGPPS